jgi:hypothetical protein
MYRIILVISFFIAINSISAQSVLGTWKTIDDDTGKPKSLVEISENNG